MKHFAKIFQDIKLFFIKKYKEYRGKNPVKVFSKIYDKSLWGNGSGSGSDPKNAKPYIELLKSHLNDKKYKSIVDLGCGDWQIMSQIIIPDNTHYIGYDLVKSVINKNITNYKKSNIDFVQIKSLEDIQDTKADLLMVNSRI